MTGGPFTRLSVAAMLMLSAGMLGVCPAVADDPSCAVLPTQPEGFADAGQLIAAVGRGRQDVPRLEIAARLTAAGFAATETYARVRENTARELGGRADGAGAVSAAELADADAAIARQIDILRGTLPCPSFAERARSRGRPQFDGLDIVYLNPLGDPARANAWRNIIVHQTEGPPGSARREAAAQFAHPTKRGVTLWVETDGTVFWSTAEDAIPTHGDGGNRNDNRYIDNSRTYHTVVGRNSLGVEFVGNFPDVARPATAAQVRTWLLLVRFLQERYRIAAENIYAHNWIDFKDRRYCEGCELATLARQLDYHPSTAAQ